jgi:hypothetical protein
MVSYDQYIILKEAINSPFQSSETVRRMAEAIREYESNTMLTPSNMLQPYMQSPFAPINRYSNGIDCYGRTTYLVTDSVRKDEGIKSQIITPNKLLLLL